MGQEFTSRTFIPLFPEPSNTASCERLLLALGANGGVPTRCVRPPLTGLAFLNARGPVATLIDEWWRGNVPTGSQAVLLMLHEAELPDWIDALDAAFVIGVAEPAALSLYQDADPERIALVQGGPQEVTEHAIRLYGGGGATPAAEPQPTSPAGWMASGATTPPPDRPAPQRTVDGYALPSSRPPISPPLPPRTPAGEPAAQRKADAGREPDAVRRPAAPGQPPPAQPLDPFQALVAARPIVVPTARTAPARSWRAQPPPAPAPARARRAGQRRGGVAALLRDLLRLSSRVAIPAELTRLALAHDRGKIVCVISRAGGVGKTATAAALGIVFGEAVQHSGWSAAVIDQNTGNPDQWGRLEVDGHVPTVSEIMANIEAGRRWDIPTWGRTPALAVYPESRIAGEAYAPAQIERLAGQLRRLHALSVIDLPNGLPAFSYGEAALSAGWIATADLVTIPTTDDPMRLKGVMELLENPVIKGDAHAGLRAVPVVVAYVRSPMRAIRQSAAVANAMDHIRERVVDVVEIPKDDRATLAIVQGKPITEIDPRLRAAYIDLALAIATALGGL